MDVRNIDLQLLVHFDTLISESHVTRAADKLGMSQPQMSAVLARLRLLFDDPLLVRTSAGMQPTARALDLQSDVRIALTHLNAALGGRTGFDPGACARTFHLAGSDSLAKLFLPGLLQVLAVEAPQVKLTLRPAVPNRIREWLETGEVDLVIGYWTRLADGLHAGPLFRQELCVIAAESHPQVQGSISLEQYCRCRHVFFGSEQSTTSTLESTIETALAALGVTRTIAVRLPTLLLTPELVSSSELIATVPRRLARRFAAVLPLQVLELPFHSPPPEISMVWHQRCHKEGPHQWLRQQLREVCEQLDTLPSLHAGSATGPGAGSRAH